MNIQTLHSSFEPIERYQKFLSDQQLEKRDGAVPIRPVDAFVLKQLIGSVPRSPTVIDLSAEATQGESSVFWATNSDIEKLFIARTGGGRDVRPAWERYATELRSQHDLAAQLTALQFIEGSSDASILAQAIQQSRDAGPAMVIHVDASGRTSKQFSLRIRELLSLGKSPLVLISSCGKTGECPALAAISSLQEEFAEYGFSLVREVNPFLAASSVGVLYPKSTADIPGILRRIGQLFEGNFDYVTLLRDHLQLTIEHKRLETRLQSISAQPGPPAALIPASASSTPAANPNLIAIHSPPKPLLPARVLRGCYRIIVPSRLRVSLAESRRQRLTGLRSRYHQRVSLLYRIVLRDIRVLFLGR